MLNDYLPIAILLVLSAVLAGGIVAAGHAIGPRRPTERKSNPYESGMTPIGPGTRRIPVRFYMVAVLFILFDIEVVFFLPFAVVLNRFIDNGLGWFLLIEMTIFFLILLVGYVYAWKKGALEWD
jgi:NADH-quinone oxidoreductase subunit A